MMTRKKWILSILILFLFPSFLMTGCLGNKMDEELLITQTIQNINPIVQSNTPIINLDNQSQPDQVKFWIDPNIKNVTDIPIWKLINKNLTDNKELANFWIDRVIATYESGQLLNETYFIVSVSFTSEMKNVDLTTLANVWGGKSEFIENVIIWAFPSDIVRFTNYFNIEPGKNVIFSETVPEVCETNTCWRISKFENADPKWKIVSIDNQSILTHEFNPDQYPFVERMWLKKNPETKQNINFPFEFNFKTNFNPEHLTSLLMTGTTALVRNTAFQIEENGLDFPLINIQEVLDSVDLIHISNEVPFYSNCPPAVPVRKEMRFCSDPKYIEILKLMGVDIVELTGNHLLDWGPEAFLETLSIYREYNISTYGGGETVEDANQPLLLEDNSNKLAFLGCNVPGPDNNWVSDTRPGSLPCNLDKLETTVRDLKKRGYIPIFTFQHYEFDYFSVNNLVKQDFWRIAKAGAVIVSGSQAHFPQGIDFVGSSFVHYGLGNFLFDQMYKYWRMSTVDVHYFYENRYINTLQYPIINENFGQPRIMADGEASQFFTDLYNNSFYFQETNQ